MFYALCQFQTQYEAKSLKVSCIKAIRFLTLKFGITLYAQINSSIIKNYFLQYDNNISFYTT